MVVTQMKLLKNSLNPFCKDTKKIYKKKMEGSDFACDGVNYLYYFNKISISRSRSYIDSPKWLKDKKSTVNKKNNDNKCFNMLLLSH